MRPITNKPAKLRKAPQPPLSYPGAPPDSDRAKRPPLAEAAASDQELNPGDRVEGLGNFGKPTGEFGTVQQANDDDAVVSWDDDGRVRVHQPSLKTVSYTHLDVYKRQVSNRSHFNERQTSGRISIRVLIAPVGTQNRRHEQSIYLHRGSVLAVEFSRQGEHF